MLINHLESIVGCRIPKSTLSDILKCKDKIEIAPESTQYRTRTAKFPELEDCLSIYINELNERKICVSEDIIFVKAREIAPEIEASGFNFSQGWLLGFKNRYGLKERVKHEEADIETVERGRAEMKKITRDYALRDINNMDETGIFL